VPKLVRNFEADWQLEWVRAEDGWKILSFGLEVGAMQGQTPLQVAETNQHHHVAHLLREHMQGNSSSSCPAGGP
jgi:hypothetical protein